MPGAKLVDAYMQTVPAYAVPIFIHLRALVHDAVPAAEEGIKWGKPTFLYKDKNLATFAAFKAHAMFAIHGDGRMSGSEADGRNLTSVSDLPADDLIRAKLLAACARIDRDGTAVKRTPTAKRLPRPELPIPDDFAAALAASPAAQAALQAFAPSHRREYIQWITEAKRPETREKRIVQAIAQLADGKKHHWEQ